VLGLGALLAASAAGADSLDDLRSAVLAFRGIGLRDVAAYRTTFRLPDDERPGEVRLEELWRAPSTYAIRSADGAPAAVIRSYAIFLEPLYVARASILDADLDTGAERLRAVAHVESVPGKGGARTVRVTLPAQADSSSDFCATSRGWRAISARTGSWASTRSWRDAGRAPETPDPCARGRMRRRRTLALQWTLPGGVVRVSTAFRNERAVECREPHVRPSRYDRAR
jgi:hypothetical protein